MINKNDFITAYMYSYGATRKEAEKVWKNATPGYKAAIIDGWKAENKKAFYND